MELNATVVAASEVETVGVGACVAALVTSGPRLQLQKTKFPSSAFFVIVGKLEVQIFMHPAEAAKQ